MTTSVEYKIVYGRDSDQLAAKVRHEISAGWLPCGGVAISATSADMYQAMTRTPPAG